jgi:beta-galactosidase
LLPWRCSREAPGAAQSAATPAPELPRERLLLDFGWRFHLGNAQDASKDFGFGSGGDGTFSTSGEFTAAPREDFDDKAWQAVDLPHDWAVDLPFKDDKDLYNHGCKPLG